MRQLHAAFFPAAERRREDRAHRRRQDGDARSRSLADGGCGASSTRDARRAPTSRAGTRITRERLGDAGRRDRVHRACGRRGERLACVARRAARWSSARRDGTTQLDRVIAEVVRARAARCSGRRTSRSVSPCSRRPSRRRRGVARRPGFDAHLVETHHAAKKDAPSGTAHRLGAASRKPVSARRFPSPACARARARGRTNWSIDARIRAASTGARGARSSRVRRRCARRAREWLQGARRACSPCGTCSHPRRGRGIDERTHVALAAAPRWSRRSRATARSTSRAAPFRRLAGRRRHRTSSCRAARPAKPRR